VGGGSSPVREGLLTEGVNVTGFSDGSYFVTIDGIANTLTSLRVPPPPVHFFHLGRVWMGS